MNHYNRAYCAAQFQLHPRGSRRNKLILKIIVNVKHLFKQNLKASLDKTDQCTVIREALTASQHSYANNIVILYEPIPQVPMNSHAPTYRQNILAFRPPRVTILYDRLINKHHK